MPEARITHRQIEAFRAVMLTNSMTDAAQLLNVTQPAVSKILTQLERELGFSLFQRRQGALRPTNEAHILYAEVKRSYTGLESLIRVARRVRHRSGGNLRLAVLPTFSAGFLPRVVRRLYAGDDRMQLSIQNYNSEEIVDLVASGLCDLGFAMTPVDPARVRTGPVMSLPSFLILPPGHRLADAGRVSVRELDGETFIATSEGTSSRLRNDALFASMNVARELLVEARWSVTIAELVRAGLGCSIIDGFTALNYVDKGCVVKPLKERLDFTFVYATPLTDGVSSPARRFIELFRAEFEILHRQCAELAAEAGGDTLTM